MAELTITDDRADLLRAIAAGNVTEWWNDNDEPGEITRHERPGRPSIVTGRVRVMRAAGLCETDPADVHLHTRGIRLTAAGEKALTDHDAERGQP